MGTSPSLLYVLYFMFQEHLRKKKREEEKPCAKAIVRYEFYFKITAVCLRQRHDAMVFLIAVMIKYNE